MEGSERPRGRAPRCRRDSFRGVPAGGRSARPRRPYAQAPHRRLTVALRATPGLPRLPRLSRLPGLPRLSGLPRLPRLPGLSRLSGYPTYPPYPPYPCPPGPPKPPPHHRPHRPKIKGPAKVTVRVDEHGRFLLGRVVVVCPARGAVELPRRRPPGGRQQAAHPPARLRHAERAIVEDPPAPDRRVAARAEAPAQRARRPWRSPPAKGSVHRRASACGCACSRPVTSPTSAFAATRSPAGRSPTPTRREAHRRPARPTGSPAAG